MRGVLCLEDGFCLEGHVLSREYERAGEVVFFTGMTGYEDALTDPSYAGQILVFTFPMIGNYGVHKGHSQSGSVTVRGVVARDLWEPSVPHASPSLAEVLKLQGCPVLLGVDTRKLVLHLRKFGVMRGIIASISGATPMGEIAGQLAEKAKAFSMKGVTREVAAKEETVFPAGANPRGKCVLVDFGVKEGIKQSLIDLGITVVAVPPETRPHRILSHSPDFVLLSNGPGDPEDNQAAIDTVRDLLGKVPLFGICLGHQILGKAVGARVVKLKYGHHGANHPVKQVQSGRILISSQTTTTR